MHVFLSTALYIIHLYMLFWRIDLWRLLNDNLPTCFPNATATSGFVSWRCSYAWSAFVSDSSSASCNQSMSFMVRKYASLHYSACFCANAYVSFLQSDKVFHCKEAMQCCSDMYPHSDVQHVFVYVCSLMRACMAEVPQAFGPKTRVLLCCRENL